MDIVIDKKAPETQDAQCHNHIIRFLLIFFFLYFGWSIYKYLERYNNLYDLKIHLNLLSSIYN